MRCGLWLAGERISGQGLLAMLVNILLPSGITSPRGALFNYDWITLVVVVIIVLIGAVYWLVARPARNIEARTRRGAGPPAEAAPVTR